MSKRIVIFSTAYAPLIGGAEIAVRELTDRLVDFDFVLVTARIKPELAREEMIGRVKVIRVGNGGRFDKLLLWWNGWKAARAEGDFDLIWGVMASYGGLAALRYKKKNPTVPFFLNLQEGDSLTHIYARAWWVWPWFKQIFTRANYIQTLSVYLAEWAKKMGANCPVTVVPNGVALPGVENYYRKDTDSKKTILSVSRLVEKNGLEYLIQAMVDLPADYELQIVGNGPLRLRLDRVVSELKLMNRVMFIGEIPNHDLPKYYAKANVFVRPSLSEGLGISFLEAMHLGVPVIATQIGGIPDFLENGVTGWFCKVRDPHDIAEKIKYVLDEKNADEVARVTKQAKELVAKKYSWELVTEQMRKIFNTICGS